MKSSLLIAALLVAVPAAAQNPPPTLRPPRTSPVPMGEPEKGPPLNPPPPSRRLTPLTPLPTAALVALAPRLMSSDMALVESNPDGSMKQVTLLLFVAAPPETVHDIVSHPGDYKTFMPNITQSTWEPRADGSGGRSSWKIKLAVSEFDGNNDYTVEPGPTGAVNLHELNPNDKSRYRWEFHAAPGGTVIAQYGYTGVQTSNRFVKAFVNRVPTLEHGLALAAQYVLATSVKKEAEKRGPRPAGGAPSQGGSINFLLERGQLAIMRQGPNGTFGEIAIADRFYAPASKVATTIQQPGNYKELIQGVDKSYVVDGKEGTQYFVEFAVPIISWATTFGLRSDGRGNIDGIGLDGDLRGARFAWSLTPKGDKETLISYRVQQQLATNMILRQLFKQEPALEYGINVGFALVWTRGIRGGAEGWGKK